ncbi:glutathione S-transferase [Vibrio sp. ZSDZ34]|uniref:Glutathione S-transferase n=1 Tax=Vibrio gelatinilyticus TaxID=2893468 RepID=A0A9X1WAV1_9VIBR|nr:glutathione S-transferase [Vibrio gelatinilyticus]MCJ2377482.1 glutathione S-transferase [Vibrio gelatinilyticus]
MANYAIPILYSLQHCPYAMRARIALIKAKQCVLIRAIKLSNKPGEMLQVSAKGSVPVLVISDDVIIEESLEVMLWALAQNDPDDLLHIKQANALPSMINTILEFEAEFIPLLEAYSCAKRYHDDNLCDRRLACQRYLQKLEEILQVQPFLFSDKESVLDIALMPFIRKFARIEKKWYRDSPYPNLRTWLARYLQSSLFSKVMTDHELWLERRSDIYFGGEKL